MSPWHSIFDVRDGDLIREVYEVPGAGLLVSFISGGPKVFSIDGTHREKLTEGVRSFFEGIEEIPKAAHAHIIGRWLLENA